MGRGLTSACASSRKPSLVVVGNGMAGMRTVEELLALAPELYAGHAVADHDQRGLHTATHTCPPSIRAG